MKQAYLILAHNNFSQLRVLLESLDCEDVDIYVHIDKKVKDFSEQELKNSVKLSNLLIFQEISVKWGDISLVEAELALFEKSLKGEPYAFYHLISGSDLPLYPQKEILDFYRRYEGKNFLNVVSVDDCSKEIQRRARYYHFFCRKSQKLQWLFDFLHRGFLALQIIFRVNRAKSERIFYGSEWCDLSREAVEYLVACKKEIIKRFKFVHAADELYKQTFLMSKGIELFSEEKLTAKSVMRYISFDEGAKSPTTLVADEFDKIIASGALFARKFDENVDREIIEKVKARVVL